MAKNILIVDDAAFMRMMIKDILSKNGYNVAGEAENGAKAVEKDDEVMLINDAGTIIRINVSGTALLSRITSGVKLIDLKENTKLISIAKVRKSDTILAEEVEELNEGSTTES